MKEAMQDVVREKLESVRAELEGPCRHSNGETARNPPICDIHKESTGFTRCVLAEVKNEIKVLIWIRPREKEVRPPVSRGIFAGYFGQVVGISWGYEPSWFF